MPIVNLTRNIAIVGLGVGSLAAYAHAGQVWTFYEIDPEIERIARTSELFSFLAHCGDSCRVVTGDGRLSLIRAEPGRYGLLILDAFSSDAIPVHLLTSEAFTLYTSRLSPGGVIAIHISNNHLDLGPILKRVADAHHLVAAERQDDVSTSDQAAGKESSDWVLLARSEMDLGAIANDSRWRTPAALASTPLWTDDFSNIVSALRSSGNRRPAGTD